MIIEDVWTAILKSELQSFKASNLFHYKKYKKIIL